jgi:hypothetical protein
VPVSVVATSTLMALPMRLRCAILTRRFSGQNLEDAVELRKRLKSDRECNFADPKIAIFQKFARLIESGARDVIDKLGSGDLFEFFAQVGGVDSYGTGHSSERKVLVSVFFNESPRFPDIPRLRPVSIVREPTPPSESGFGRIF